jgi:hypothetical protein
MTKGPNEDLDGVFVTYSDPCEGWRSRTAGRVLVEEYARWIRSLTDWPTFATLTFRTEVSPSQAKRLLRQLAKEVTLAAHGPDHKRGSYFSYVYCIEYQKREVLHLHVLIDRAVDGNLIEGLWEKWAGNAQVEPTRDLVAASIYICKDVARDGQVDLYLADDIYQRTVCCNRPSRP